VTSFSLRSLKLRSGEEYQDEQDIALTPLEFGGQRYLPVPESVQAELRASRATTGTVFELDFVGRLHGPCQRCLADAVVERHVRAREYQAAAADAADELKSPYIDADRLDLSAWARDALVLSLPEQILCRTDCAGLCPVCGKDLNVEPHEHEEERSDPRWAVLEQLREKL
jgi:uncharacterized protein